MYDAGNETLIADFRARSGNTIASLTSDQVAGHCSVACFVDGAVQAFDTRFNPRSTLIQTWKQHNA
jgi:hypothetical protein